MSFKKISPIYMNKYRFVDDNIKGKNKKVLDIGCGYGEYLELLQSKGLDVKGIDVDKEAVASNKKIIEAPAENIPFKDGTFDIITCIDVLEHVNDHQKSMKEISRVMKKDGKLILTVPNTKFPITYDPVNFVLRYFKKKAKIGIWHWGHRRLFSKNETFKLIEINGFKIIHFEQRSHIFICLFTNYIPYIIDKFITKGNYSKKKKSNLFTELIKHSYAVLNIIDFYLCKSFQGFSLCIVAKKRI